MKLLERLNLLKGTSCEEQVKQRISQFREIGSGSEERIFQELCFCVLTANYSAKGGIFIQNRIKEGFLYMNEDELKSSLRDLGYRFWNPRYRFIVENRRLLGSLKDFLESKVNSFEKRSFLVKEVKGFGMKEASHFLRNVGIFNVAILDRHILRVMKEYGYLDDIPKTITEKTYINLEKVFFQIADDFGKPPGVLDLYIWYMEKGCVDK
ncbi:MAG TPA: N-glycosylase/DNA lyase [Thermodesulfobium narugense]|uniref:8-oxoguanine DNA glycosylase/AP lyase n=1 Tax=Thermodesulfobium acidiphilum TaxID=1794699 RepID=A0A2R4VYU9_THEAF|nr:N-glycosylase/DNA lyase [Thermodesulfobium acidiphilum]AWB09692.1 N-glycosylase/DNA lyase [Thermodesulfobium acidiphilum]HEM55483.1 N-glycosylase/DNA lyase [Thermodesulfobium narugense]